jgi:hypothetical protein
MQPQESRRNSESQSFQAELADPLVLLVVGLLPPSMARSESLPETNDLVNILLSRWQKLQGRAWPWRLRESVSRLIRSQEDADRLIEAGRVLIAAAEDDWARLDGRGLRLEVNVPKGFDPSVLYRSLQASGLHSAFLRSKNEGEVNWSWPLRVGIAGNSQLTAAIGPTSSLKPLFRAFNYEHPSMRANLLLCEGSLVEAAATLGTIQPRPQADALIIFGGGGFGETTRVDQSLSFISEVTEAQGIFIFEGLDHSRAQNFTEGVLAYLAHDLPIDSAVARLAREGSVSVLSFATRRLVEATSVREQGRILARRLQQMQDVRIPLSKEVVPGQRGMTGATFDQFKDTLPTFGLNVRSAGSKQIAAKELGQALERSLEVPQVSTGAPSESLLSFHRERDGASKLAKVADAVDTASDAEASRRESRYLQARVETPSGRRIQGEARMLSERDYVASVFIGARNQEWLGLSQPLKEPEPPEGSPLFLDVLFWEPLASPEPQVKSLTLLPQGDSAVVEFPFRIATNQMLFSARIAVYHRNRNLQTGILRGNIGDQPAELSFTVDAAPLPKFVGLSDRIGVGASLIINDDADGNMQAFGFRDRQASVAKVSDEKQELAVGVNAAPAALAELTAALGRAITRITATPEEFSDLSKEGTRTLLLDLALHGSALRTRLTNDSLMGTLFDDVDDIQIVSAHPDAFFPLEYLYDGEAPEDNARICNKDYTAAANALVSGTCCGAYDGNPYETICPMRFWSMRKVIERHAYRPADTNLDTDFQLCSASANARKRLVNPLSGSVVAASNAAAAAVKDTVDNMVVKMDAVLKKPAVRATDWASWARSIDTTRPNLLVLLPHHVQEGGFDFLEIGGAKRKSMQIRTEHVRSLKDPDAHPIVLLIGCQTNAAKIDLEGFVPYFKAGGAVIIVSTIATILGRQAGPTAAAIVEEIKKLEGDPSATFGKVMRAVRRRLLAEGTPMVLGLTSYGDADWRIER